ncbi:MAG: T9SS type A sorting domain-containing protein [Bacteroidetes bacterium]|nr:MAG: T9SS type A sorting domain-containing protein [Bacteroidota bacterium]
MGKGENTVFTSTSKSGDNPRTWTIGTGNIGDKTDLINTYAHARRDANDSLWFFIAAERLTTGGATTVDFEFLKEGLMVSSGAVIPLGPDSGRTAGVVTTPVVNGGGTISKPGDLLIVTEYGGSSVTTYVYMWTLNPPSGVTFDQGSSVGPYGWALINPPGGSIIATQNSSSVETGAWGTFQGSAGDSTNILATKAFVEVGLNMTRLGLEVDTTTCSNIGQAIVRSRTSPSFSSNLSDFVGPLSFQLNTCATIRLEKYFDSDGNIGTTGDQSSKDWNLSLYRYSVTPENLVATVSSANSLGALDTLRHGTYIAVEADSLGWAHLGVIEESDARGLVTSPGSGNSFTINAARGDSVTVRFINAQYGSIGGKKFRDVNANRTKDESDPGLPNWVIELQNTSGTVLSSDTTDSNGDYLFTDLTPGATYRVREVQQSPWEQTSTNPSDMSISSGTTVTGVNFGNAKFTTTNVTTSPNPSQRFESVTFTATVTPSSATGTVEFFDGVTSLGTASLSSGTASIATASLIGGTHSITAQYGGDSEWNGSMSSSHTHVVIRTATTTTLNATPSPSVYGQSVSLDAAISPSLASGTVEFFDGALSLGSATISAGSASLSVSSLDAGAHSLTAKYSGDADYDTSSSSPFSHNVQQVATTTSIAAPAITYNANGNVTVTVSSTAGIPSGNVTLTVDGGSPMSQPLTSGSTTFTVAGLNAGEHSLNASYVAQGNFAASSTSGTIQVNRAATTTALSAPAITYNANGTVTVTVSSSAGTPAGNVSLSVDGSIATTMALTSGSATFTITSPSAGDHSLNAAYAAQGNFDSSSITGNLHVNLAPVTVAISAPTVTYNSNGLVTVTVSSAAGMPTGDVSLSVDGSPSTAQPLINGSSIFTILSPSAGDHNLSATYQPQGNFDGNNNTGTLHVNQAPTTTSIVASDITYGANGLVIVSVSSSAGMPSGSVSLSVDGGAASTQTLTSGSANFALTLPSGGNHTLSATYSAQGNFDASSANGNLLVNKASSSVSLGSSNNPSILGESVAFTATISSPTSTGSVEFFDGATSLGTGTVSGGIAQLSTTSLIAGDHSISAQYSGDGNYLGSTSSSLTQTVNNPVPTTTSIFPASKAVGSPAFTLTINGTNFLPVSVARFNGSARATIYLNSTQVQAQILMSDVTALGSYPITVFNPTPGGGESNAQQFDVVGASISGMKYNDLNGNRNKDSGEPGLPNWTIILGGVSADTQITDSEGSYFFSVANSGTYTVSEVGQNGWVQTSASPEPIVITIGQAASNVNFGNFKSPVLSGFKFEDVNGDSLFNENEPRLSGWEISATNGVATKTTTTDAEGAFSFSFNQNETGSWTISEALQAGWSQLYPSAGTYSILVQSADDVSNLNFGNFRPASISGQKFNDFTGDSAITGDAGLNGWVIQLWKDSLLVAVDTTSGNGNYSFDNLLPASYTIQEIVQSGWIQTYPPEIAYTVTLSSGDNITGKDFANFQLGSISGAKFLDFDGDSLKDAGEIGLENWTIILSNGVDNDTALTDVNGAYSFTNLTAGEYQISEVVQPGWYQTMPATGSYQVTVNSGTNSTGLDFGNFEYGSIRGTAWFDRDSSGTQNTGCEGMLPGLKLVLSGTHTSPDTVIADENGEFSFSNISADTYTMTTDLNPLWRITFPTNGTPYILTVTSGLDTSGFVFGNFYMPDTTKYRTFILTDYNASARAIQKSGFIRNPTAGNVRKDIFLRKGFGLDTPTDSGYLRIGVRRPDSSLVYGWFFHRWTVYKDAAVKQWIYNKAIWGTKRNPKTKTQIMRNPPFYLRIIGQQSTETYFGNAGNHLTAELTTLKTNIAASDLEITPKGFGDLLYICRDGYSDSMFTGMTLRQIVSRADTALTMGRKIVQVTASQKDTSYLYPVSYLIALDTVIGRINREFRLATSKLDTISTKPLKLKGIKGLYKVSYLMRDSIAPPPLARFDMNAVVEEQPAQYRLDQNYPNPFNPQTVIQFELMAPSAVTLKIFNLLGQEVATVFDNQQLDEGVQAIEFDATEFSSGVYFYRLEAKGTDANGQEHSFKSVKKMTLIK